MAIRLFVGNLPYNTTEAELREHFSSVGQLSYVYVPVDKETGKPRGFAFVEFNDRGQADEAIRRFNNQPFKGRNLAINEARAREDRPQSAPPRSGFAPRPASPPPFSRPSEFPPDDVGRGGKPDAPPRRTRKAPSRGFKAERGPKGPIRERTSGQIFGGDDEYDEYQDDLFEEDNFATSERGDDNEDDE